MWRALKPSLNWLLPLTPIAIVMRFVAPEAHIWLFFLAGVAIIPIAGWMGKATEHLAARTGEGIGGLLNATFGNMAELIIAIMALRQGLTEILARDGVATQIAPGRDRFFWEPVDEPQARDLEGDTLPEGTRRVVEVAPGPFVRVGLVFTQPHYLS